MSADHWPDHVRLSDIEPLFICQACGKRGADVRPDHGRARMRTTGGKYVALTINQRRRVANNEFGPMKEAAN
jgi:hypothetical protein